MMWQLQLGVSWLGRRSSKPGQLLNDSHTYTAPAANPSTLASLLLCASPARCPPAVSCLQRCSGLLAAAAVQDVLEHGARQAPALPQQALQHVVRLREAAVEL